MEALELSMDEMDKAAGGATRYKPLNQKAGWLGETSTEISGAEDLHQE